MKIEIEGSVKEITDLAIELRSRLFMNTVDVDEKPEPKEDDLRTLPGMATGPLGFTRK